MELGSNVTKLLPDGNVEVNSGTTEIMQKQSFFSLDFL